MSKLRMFSHFAGIGGFDIAAKWTGKIETVGACEKEKHCREVLLKRFPKIWLHDDAFTLTAELIREHCGWIDIFVGGFPCQPFSVAGKRAGEQDERYLWPEMLRVIRTLSPEWVIAENVPGLRTKGADRVLEGLAEAGYTPEALVVGAEDVAAPHRRKRVWIVAVSNSSRSAGESRPERPGWQAWSDAYRSSEGSELADSGWTRCREERRGSLEVLAAETRFDALGEPDGSCRSGGITALEIATSERLGFEGGGEGGTSDCTGAFSRLNGASSIGLADSSRELLQGGRIIGTGRRGEPADERGVGQADANSSGRGERCEPQHIPAQHPAAECGSPDVAHAGHPAGSSEHEFELRERSARLGEPDGPGIAQSGLGQSAYGLPTGLDGHWPAPRGCAQYPWEAPRTTARATGPGKGAKEGSAVPNRQARLKALGNAIVPQVAYHFLMAILELDDKNK